MSFFTIDPKSLATDWYRVFLDPLLLIYKALRLDMYIERFSYTFLRTLYLIKAVIVSFFFSFIMDVGSLCGRITIILGVKCACD